MVKKSGEQKKGPMAEFQAYWVNESKEAGKKFDIKINSKAEKEAYERGKEYYYSAKRIFKTYLVLLVIFKVLDKELEMRFYHHF